MNKTRKIIAIVLYVALILAMLGFVALGIYKGEEVSFADLVKIGVSIIAGVGVLLGVRGKGRESLQFYESQYEKELRGAFTTNKKLRKQLVEAVRLYNEDKLKKAVNLLIKLEAKCENRQDFCSVLLMQALCFTDMNLTGQAIGAYNRLLRYDSTNSTAYSNLGLIYSKDGDYRMAVDCFEMALKNDGENPFAYNNMATVYFRMNQYEEAIVYAEKALQLKGNLYQAATLLAIVYSRLDEVERAEHYYQIAVNNGQDKSVLRNAMYI